MTKKVGAFYLLIWLMFSCISTLQALENADPSLLKITNYRQYSSAFASAGQPNREQFQLLKEKGFERIVYIAFSNSGTNAIPDEDTIVKNSGMEYLQIPVDFQKPLASEFYIFADAMRRYPNKKTLLHCQVNARATAFSFLYRVLYDNISITEAKKDMNTVWQPSAQWRDFIFSILKENNKSPHCEGCDWTLSKQK